MINKNKVIQVICFLFAIYLLSFPTAQARNKIFTSCQSSFVIKKVKRLTQSLKIWRRSSSSKNIAHGSDKILSKTKGVESYNEALVREVKSLLGKELIAEKIKAIEKANNIRVVIKNSNKDTSEMAIIRQQTEILKKEGFSKKEIRTLMESGIVWVSPLKTESSLFERLQKGLTEGKKLYFAGNPSYEGKQIVGKIHKILKKEDDGFLVEVDILDSPSGTLIRDRIFIKNYSEFHLVQPKYEILFEAAQSKRKIITSKELNIPSFIREETDLTKKGYSLDFIKGFDNVNEWAFVRRRLQELKANPYTTHVEYFANTLKDRIKHIKKGIGLPINSTKIKRLKKLKELEKEAKQAIDDKAVTYKWWLEFHEKLSVVLGNYPSESGPARFLFGEQNIALFPLKMMVPTKKGSLGVMTFNKAENEGIYPLGFINKPERADGDIHAPPRFMVHDLFHTRIQLDGFRRLSIGHDLFRKRFLESIEELPVRERKKVEWLYFEMIHEEVSGYLLYPGNNNSGRLIHQLHEVVAKEAYKNSSFLILFSRFQITRENGKKLTEYDHSIVDDYVKAFMKAYDQAQFH